MLFHITTPEAWEEALNRGKLRPASLKTEGFVHLSTRTQLAETLATHFAEAEEVLVLYVVARRLQADQLKWEPVASRNQAAFPHYYAPLPIESIENCYLLQRTNSPIADNTQPGFDLSILPGQQSV